MFEKLKLKYIFSFWLFSWTILKAWSIRFLWRKQQFKKKKIFFSFFLWFSLSTSFLLFSGFFSRPFPHLVFLVDFDVCCCCFFLVILLRKFVCYCLPLQQSSVDKQKINKIKIEKVLELNICGKLVGILLKGHMSKTIVRYIRNKH